MSGANISTRPFAALVVSVIAYFHVFTIAHSATLSFDGGDPAPLKSEKVTFVKGLSGDAAHLGRDSILEFQTALPGFMTPTAGTFVVWFKHDDTFPCSHRFRDSVVSENGHVQWILNSGFFQRTLFASGGATIGGGVKLSGKMASAAADNSWGRRVLGGEWHCLAFAYDAACGGAIWMADGVVMKECKIPAEYRLRFADRFTLGCGDGKAGLEGAIDEVTFLPVALDEDALRKEYLKYQPIRYELHDWSVSEGETKVFRFRARNESAEKVDKKIKFSNGATVALSLAPNEMKEFTVDVKGGKPGLFKLWLNEGEPDARQFKCMCLGKEPRNTRNTRKVLIGEYDCTKEYPLDRVSVCASEVVTNGNLVYRESRERGWAAPLALYRFKIRNQGKPHFVEVDYPDDKVRMFIAAVYPEKWGRLYSVTADCAGFMTGIDYPLSMENQTKSFVFWPDSETVSVLIQNYKGDKMHGEHAAVSAVRMYEADFLPSGPVQGVAENMRTVAQWDEDPTIDAAYVAANAWNFDRADLEFWRIKWQRIIEYMRWNSMDSWVLKTVAYNGDSTGMYATIPEAALPWDTCEACDGRCRGWAELGADMLGRAGMGFWVRINHRDDTGWFTRLGGGDTDKKGKSLDVRNPATRKAYLRLVAAYRDKFGRYPGFRGVTLNEYLPVFCPGGQREMEDFAKELGATIRADGGNAEVQIWVAPWHCNRDYAAKWEGRDAEKMFGEFGVDAAALSKIPGVRIVPCVRPDFCRKKGIVSDEEFFQDSDSFVRYMRDGGLDCINVFRCSNLEIWPGMGAMGGVARAWTKGIWLPAGNIFSFVDNFQSYATPHARSPYTLDSVASLIADCDMQDFLTGWWGLMESGEHDEWCRFYAQFRKIPRGRYDLAKGPDDPVCVRSGAEGHYLVNREPYPVKVEYVVDGEPETLILRHHEIRFVKGRGANGAVEVKWAKIPTAEKATHLANLEKLEAAAKADEKNATLARAAKEARAAFDEGRFHRFRALFHLAEVRRVFNPDVFTTR